MAVPHKSASSSHNTRVTLMMTAMAVLFVLVPVLFWHGTWFGRALTDQEITAYLADKEKPRKAQHALAQVSQRISQRDPSVRQWYPQILSLADHPLPELRLTVAWLMGEEGRSQAFHDKLLEMLEDPDPLVRRNAALSLAGFGDPAARPALREMLRNYTVTSPHSGVLKNRLAKGDVVARDTLLARVSVEGQPEPAEIRSPLPGVVEERLKEDGAPVAAGEEVMVLGPSADHAFEALRALYLVGTLEDLEDVQRFRTPRDDLSVRIAQQAGLTVEQIRSRAGR